MLTGVGVGVGICVVSRPTYATNSDDGVRGTAILAFFNEDASRSTIYDT